MKDNVGWSLLWWARVFLTNNNGDIYPTAVDDDDHPLLLKTSLLSMPYQQPIIHNNSPSQGLDERCWTPHVGQVSKHGESALVLLNTIANYHYHPLLLITIGC